ncbi:MAG: DUF3018 family protein [Gammaproteobacteria bacterium]|nr:DUF3018 family protein [Gammaproteobacteria bacterium]
MATPANERMRAWRDRQRRSGRREIRMVLPDARLPDVRERVAASVSGLDQRDEEDALGWIEEVSEFDARSAR